MSGQLHRDENMYRQLNDVANSGAGEGGFAFDEATMRSIVTSWLDLAVSYARSRRSARDMGTVTGPGLDLASEGQALAASESGTSYLEYLKHNETYCLEQAQLFQNALDDYLGVEHTNIIEINKSDSPEPRAGI